jgi:hypothetical protein
MPGVFVIKVYDPKPFSSNRVRARILNALKQQGQRGAANFMPLTTRFWDDPPKFDYALRYSGGQPRLLIFPTGTLTQVGKWYWLNYGTKERWAVMTNPFKAKTSVGSLSNTRGVGRMNYVMNKKMNKKKNKPKPGIQARNWHLLIQRKMQPDFTRKMNEAIRKGLETR